MTDWIAEDKKYLFQNYGRQPIVLEKGEGTRCWDIEGREYLDFVGGLAVNVLGHAHPVVAKAVAEQAATLIHTSNLYYTKPMIELAKILVENSFADRCIFLNSGAEAIEAAIKLARRWGKDTKDGAFEVISAQDGFHGRTMGSLAATGTVRYREPFEPMVPGFSHVPWNDIEAIKAATTPMTAAVLLEPIQGEGGVNMPAPGYLQGVRDWCTANNVLLIFDEIQTGNGRTGKLFAYETEGVVPDIMALAKGINSGYVPLGATAVGERVASAWQAQHPLAPIMHGYTYSGHPLACAAALANLDIVEREDLPGNALRQGAYFLERMQELLRYPIVGDVRGKGLMLAAELVLDKESREPLGMFHPVARRLFKASLAAGLLIRIGGNKIILSPPLVIEREHVDFAMDALHVAFREAGAP